MEELSRGNVHQALGRHISTLGFPDRGRMFESRVRMLDMEPSRQGTMQMLPGGLGPQANRVILNLWHGKAVAVKYATGSQTTRYDLSCNIHHETTGHEV